MSGVAVSGAAGSATPSGRVRSTGLPSSSTAFGVVDEELECLASGQIRAYRLQAAPLSEIAAHLVGLLADALGQPGDLGVEVLIGRLDGFLSHDGPQGQVGPHRGGGPLAQAGEEGLLVLAGGREVLLDRGALVAQPVGEVLEAAPQLLVDEGLGHLDVDEAGDGLEDLVAQRHLALHLADQLEAPAHVAAQLVDGVELARLGRPLVVGGGQDLALGLLDEDLERDFLAVALAEALVEDGVELEDVARPLAAQLDVELGHEHPRADLVEEVGCGERVDDVVVDVALDVDLA